MKPIRVFDTIRRRRILIFGLIFVLVAGSLTWFGWDKLTKRTKAGITVSIDGQTVAFGSGYYSVDSFGKVYTKTGSPIANTADAMYPYVSYLSAPYIISAVQLDLTGKDVTIASGATVLMEGSLSFNSLDVQTGGLITQPQPDREGYINRYQYSDQEWGTVLYGFLKVDNGQKRKLVCPSDYYTDPTTNRGNGCSISYSPTYDGSTGILSLADWISMDQVWQTGSAAFNVARYTDPGAFYINNATGITQYYPVRFKFKNDNRDNRLEPMQVILRDDTNALVGSANGVAETLIYGVDPAGAVDLAKLHSMDIGYNLADQYLPTMSSPALGWIAEDFSGTYQSYFAENINLTTFFAGGYGELVNGVFDLEFDDRIAYDGTVASTPFAKGTSGAVYDPEVYRTYTASAKVINTQMLKGSASRYIPAGLTIDVQNGEVKFSGGYIDVSGKGYAGYNMELRNENDAPALLSVRGGGSPLVAGSSGGLSSNNVPQSAAHAGNGGGGRDKLGVDIAANTNVYDTKTTASTLGSGAGGASQAAAVPSRGGNGGGYVFVRAKILRFTTKTTGIKANGDNGYQIASGWTGSGGGSGGTVAVAAASVYYPKSFGTYFDASGGVGFQENDSTIYSSGGGGGYVRLAFSSFYVNGVSTASTATVITSLRVSGGTSGTDVKFYGGIGQYFIDFSPIANMSFPKEDKTVSITRGPGESGVPDSQVLPTDTVNVNLDIHGLTDPTVRGAPEPVDVVLVSDISGSMNNQSKLTYLKEAANAFIDSAYNINQEFPDLVNLGLVSFCGSGGPIADPFGTSGSYSYNGNFMSTNPTVFQNEFKPAINAYTAISGCLTPAGSGLNNAINHFNSSFGRPGAEKFIVFSTDGMENSPTCITGPAVPDNIYCKNSVVQFYANGQTPQINYPLDRLQKESIGLITIALTLNSNNPEDTGADPKTYLNDISEYARPDYFKDDVFYDVNDLKTLKDTFEQVFGNLTTAAIGAAMEIHETLPPGAVLVGDLKPPIITPSGKKIIPHTIVDRKTNRTTLIWDIASRDYQPKAKQAFDAQHFITTVRFTPGNVISGEFQDVDQNRLCFGSTPGDTIEELNSFADYQPVGNYTVAVDSPMPNPVPFDSFCRQFFSNMIQGDVYGLSNVLPKFAQLGQHLYQSGDTTIDNDSTAFYKMSSYKFNPAAQSYWRPGGGTNHNQAMTDTINRLKQNAKPLPSSRLLGIFDGICGLGLGTSCSETNQYPDGRFWLTDKQVNINGSLNYQRKSTIIIDNASGSRNLVISRSVSPVATLALDSNIGFIVKNGDVVISNSGSSLRKINASMFVPNGSIKITGNNIWLTGSFIATNFIIDPKSTNIRFLEDARGESKWPPGFREIHSVSTASN